MPFEFDSLGKTEHKTAIYTWLESLAICVASVVFGLSIRPEDPFFTEQGLFPWPVIAPILVGVRYGFSQGFTAALLIIVSSLFFSIVFKQPSWVLPTAYGLGMLIVAMLVGEFRDIWERRLSKLERSNDYRQARLEEFTRTFHTLKISHDRLEQESAGQLNSLRSAMFDLRSDLASKGRQNIGLESCAPKIVDIFKHYGVLQRASLHSVTEGVVQEQVLDSIGDMSSINVEDLLIRKAIDERTMMSVRANAAANLDSVDETDYAACIPLVDSEKQVRAVLVIKQMPFFSFNEANLKLMSILAGRIADLLMAAEEDIFIDDEDQQQFLRYLKRSIYDARHFELDATLLAFTANNPTSAHAYLSSIQSEMRGLDVGFTTINKAGKQCLLLLMPLTDEKALESYMVRFEQFLVQQHGVSVDEAQIDMLSRAVTAETKQQDIIYFLDDEVMLDQPMMQKLDYLQGLAA